MLLRPCSLGFALGILFGGSVLLTSILSQCCGGYGSTFLEVMASIYPGFEASGGFGDIVIGSLYGFADGFLGGAILAWLYNRCSSRCGGE